jgi:hypothetical protein
VAEARGQFWNPEEEESTPFEAVTGGFVKAYMTEKINCVAQ